MNFCETFGFDEDFCFGEQLCCTFGDATGVALLFGFREAFDVFCLCFGEAFGFIEAVINLYFGDAAGFALGEAIAAGFAFAFGETFCRFTLPVFWRYIRRFICNSKKNMF